MDSLISIILKLMYYVLCITLCILEIPILREVNTKSWSKNEQKEIIKLKNYSFD